MNSSICFLMYLINASDFQRPISLILYGSILARPIAIAPPPEQSEMTLADEDTNSILTDNANMSIQGNVAMQIYNLVASFRTNAIDVTFPANANQPVGQIATNKIIRGANFRQIRSFF